MKREAKLRNQDLSVLRRIQAIKFHAFGEWDRFKLVYGKETIYVWNEADRMGPELAYFLGLELMPLLHDVSELLEGRRPSDKFKKENVVGKIIVAEIAKIQELKTKPESRDLAYVVLANANAELRRLKAAEKLPDHVRGKTSITYVRRILRGEGYVLGSQGRRKASGG